MFFQDVPNSDDRGGRNMDMDTRTILFLISMSLVAVMVLIFWLLRVIKDAHLRRTLTKEKAVEQFCRGDVLDLNSMFRMFRVSTRPHLAKADHGAYRAYLGPNDKIELSMHRSGQSYYLDLIRNYQDYNWQFSGWYDTYDGRRDRGEREFRVFGCFDDEVKAQRRLPSFKLTRKAVEQLFEALEMSTK